MNTGLQNKAWHILPKEFKEEVKRKFQLTDADCIAYEILIDLFGLHNLTSDAEGEEMLTVSRKQIDVLQSEIFKTIMDAHDADDWQDAAHYILDVMPRSFAALFGSKCLPYELNEDNFTKSEPKPAEPKFKVGDKVRVCSKDAERYGKIGEVIQVYPSGVVDIDFGDSYVGGHFYGAWAIEPYTEPKKKRHVSVKEACEILGVDESEATTLVKSKPIETCTDDCSSPDHFVVKDEMVDNNIKDGFKNHNRLNIAAMAMQGILSNIDLFKNVLETGMETLGGDGISFRAVAKSSFLFADALINEAEERGSK